jgi:hypothetical protein
VRAALHGRAHLLREGVAADADADEREGEAEESRGQA